MPKRRRTYKRKKSRKYARRRKRYSKRRRRKLPPLVSTRGLLPNKCRRRHMYCTQYIAALTNGSTVGVEKVFNCNNLYDPDTDLGGHQPYGYDQMGTYYLNYIVTGVTAHFKIGQGNNSGTESTSYIYTRWQDSDNKNSAPTSYENAVELPHYNPQIFPSTGAVHARNLSFSNQNIPKLLGVVKTDERDQLVGLTPNTPPSRGLELAVGFGNTVVDNVGNFVVTCKLILTVEWFNPKQFGTS